MADQYCFDRAKEAFADGLLAGDGKRHPVTLILRGGQSDSNRAAQVAGDLINNDKVDILLAASPWPNVCPVADQALPNQVPFLRTYCPSDNYIFPRGVDISTVLQYSYNAFWCTEYISPTFYEL